MRNAKSASSFAFLLWLVFALMAGSVVSATADRALSPDHVSLVGVLFGRAQASPTYDGGSYTPQSVKLRKLVTQSYTSGVAALASFGASDEVMENLGGMYSVASPTKGATVVYPGRYMVICCDVWAASATGTRQAYIYQRNSGGTLLDAVSQTVNAAASGRSRLTTMGEFLCAAGDYFEHDLTAGASINFEGNASTYDSDSTWSVTRLP